MNRIAEVAIATPLKNRFELESQLRQLEYRPVELAAALKDTHASARRRRSISPGRTPRTSTSPINVSCSSAPPGFDEAERRTLIKGYRLEGQGRGVVHAISQLPRAQARVIMRDFVLKHDGKDDKAAMRDVLLLAARHRQLIQELRHPSARRRSRTTRPSSTSSRTSPTPSSTPSTPLSTPSARSARRSSTPCAHRQLDRRRHRPPRHRRSRRRSPPSVSCSPRSSKPATR